MRNGFSFKTQINPGVLGGRTVYLPAKRWTFADPDQAKKKAIELAEAMITGQAGSINSSPDLLDEVLAEIDRRRLRIRPRRILEIIRDACDLVEPDEILRVACSDLFGDNFITIVIVLGLENSQ